VKRDRREEVMDDIEKYDEEFPAVLITEVE
jgi:hypothetical protein